MLQSSRSVALGCGIVIWKENVANSTSKDLMFCYPWIDIWEYEIHVLYPCSHFASVFFTNCDLVQLNEPWRLAAAATEHKLQWSLYNLLDCRAASKPESCLHLLCLSLPQWYALFAGKRRESIASCELGCCRVRKCPSVFRKRLMIDSKCWDRQW